MIDKSTFGMLDNWDKKMRFMYKENIYNQVIYSHHFDPHLTTIIEKEKKSIKEKHDKLLEKQDKYGQIFANLCHIILELYNLIVLKMYHLSLNHLFSIVLKIHHFSHLFASVLYIFDCIKDTSFKSTICKYTVYF